MGTGDIVDRPFEREDLELLGLSPGGTYETAVTVEVDGDIRTRPLGLRVTSCGLFVTVFLPSRSFGGMEAGDRFVVNLPSWRDAAILVASTVGRAQETGIEMYPFERSEHPRLTGCPGLLVEVSMVEKGHVSDELGEAEVRHLHLRPLQSFVPSCPWSPVCRAQGQIVEAAILLSRGDREGASELLAGARRHAPYELLEFVASMENLI